MGQGITVGVEDLCADWENIVSRQRGLWEQTLAGAEGGPDILVATGTGGHVPMSVIESMLAVALTLRGARVHILLCDKILPACLMAEKSDACDEAGFGYQGHEKQLCERCFNPVSDLYKNLGFKVHKFSDYIAEEDYTNTENTVATISVESILDYKKNGVSIGEHAYAGALRYFARGDLQDEENGELMLRRFFKSSLLTAIAAEKVMADIHFHSVCFHHGIYVPQGIIGEVARKNSIPVINWNPAYRKQRFIFSHNKSYHYTMMDEPCSAWEQTDWNPNLEKQTMAYLESREEGKNDWIWFNKNQRHTLSDLKREFDIDDTKTCIGMLTNVVWDAQLHYRQNAFRNILDWADKTIAYFCKRPDLQLIIRIHPAEITGGRPSRQLFADEIKKRYPTLPSNIFVIPPENDVSTYRLMDLCNAVVIYGTKMGIELTSRGIPTIVAGEAWIRNKGLTLDVESEEMYFKLLDTLPFKKGLDQTIIEKARKYAFHFFFRRMIPLSFIKPHNGAPFYKFDIKSFEDLIAGKDKGLDIICKGIMEQGDFIYPAENEQRESSGESIA